MKLQVRDILALNAALDGVLKGGNPQITRLNNEDVVSVLPFKLTADILQWAVTSQGRLTALVRAHNANMAALARTVSSGTGTIKPGTPEMVSFQQQSEELLDSEKNVRLLVLPIEKLKLDENPGIAQYLHGLKPTLKLAELKAGAVEEPELTEAELAENEGSAVKPAAEPEMSVEKPAEQAAVAA